MTATTPATAIFSNLYRDHHGWLHNWLWRKLGSQHDAADLASDTFLRLLLNKSADIADAPLREPRAYLSTMAQGLLANHWRRLAIERAYLETLAARPETHAPSAEQRALIMETLCRIDAMLEQLPDKARQAFMLAQFDGLTYGAIALRLAVSERMVKKYMAQAMLQCMLIVDPDAP